MSVELCLPGADFVGTVQESHDGVFRIGTFPAAGRTGVQVWLATYAPEAAARVRELGARAQELLDKGPRLRVSLGAVWPAPHAIDSRVQA